MRGEGINPAGGAAAKSCYFSNRVYLPNGAVSSPASGRRGARGRAGGALFGKAEVRPAALTMRRDGLVTVSFKSVFQLL
ncbi:hypothetical protein EVAR_21186_1 [Eumeta japonica]|uniref:Uncharacterized protein n=1 Tax=Eumeta variegata TaxID=151549 RepID=A0A4C1UQ18_EUMVA|nr:hypothetical protein EVAR_21186_1 [Eumeta japonica]